MFVTALFPVAKRWEQPKGPLTGEWINQLWDIRSPLQRKEVLINSTVSMNLKNMLSER